MGTLLKLVTEFLAYPEDEKLCVIKHLQEYLKKTQVLLEAIVVDYFSAMSSLMVQLMTDLRILLVFYQLPAWLISL